MLKPRARAKGRGFKPAEGRDRASLSAIDLTGGVANTTRVHRRGPWPRDRHECSCRGSAAYFRSQGDFATCHPQEGVASQEGDTNDIGDFYQTEGGSESSEQSHRRRRLHAAELH